MRSNFAPTTARSPKVKLQWFFRNIRLRNDRKRLENKNFSIISNNCLGGMITHDYLQPQLSPTVNLFIPASDFIRLLRDLKKIIKCDISQLQTENPYPVGIVNDCRIDFMHYHTFDEAREKWTLRSKRIDWNNLLLILVERDGCTYENLKEFDELPYKNKVAIVHRPYDDIKCAIVFPGFLKDKEVGTITDWKNLFGKRKYDEIDWVDILNKMEKF